MKRVPYASIILENTEGEVLLLLRDNRSTVVYPNHWTLIGGKVADGETPEMAARRELEQQMGLQAHPAFWKRYDREHPLFIVDQHVFVATMQASGDLLPPSADTQFFKPGEIAYLKIGYGFKELLSEYFLTKKDR